MTTLTAPDLRHLEASLQAQPQAVRCIGCESRHESRHGQPARHPL